MHGFKYRLALVADGICVLRYDNESGEVEMAYHFTHCSITYSRKIITSLSVA